MCEEKYGAPVERGRITAAENGRYRVASITRAGITSPPIKPLFRDSAYEVGEIVYFFLFSDGDGLILDRIT